MFARIRELERQVAELKLDLAHAITERDEAIGKAMEMCHLATYAAEQCNRKGLVLCKSPEPTE